MIPQKLGTLESVDLRQIWLDEARDFTPWLAQAEILQLLSNAVGLELEFEGMEMPVGPYKADIVANETLTECRAVIENQLERTHDHLGPGNSQRTRSTLLGVLGIVPRLLY